MEKPERDAEIKDTDIVFDCTHCGKSLAIDYRGAGLTIPCTDCGKPVEVPIPDGMELADFDSSEEEQELRILNLRRSLSLAEERVEQLEQEFAALSERRELLEQGRVKSLQQLSLVFEKAQAMQQALAVLTTAAAAMVEASQPEG